MQTTTIPTQDKSPAALWQRINSRTPARHGMSGIEAVVQVAVLLLFGAFFALPLIFMFLAPTRLWQDMYDLNRSPHRI